MNPPDPNLVRLRADGELTPSQQAHWDDFERTHPQEAARLLESQEQLRRHVQKVMTGSEAAPPLLLAAIRNDLRRAMPAQPARSRNIFAEPFRANFLAVAATLALIVGAVLFGIFGRTIDDVARPAVATDLISDAALFAEKEHRVCAGNARVMGTKIVEIEIDRAAAYLSQWLETPVQVFDLTSAGYEFIGAGECGMPVPARSGHLLYRKISDDDRRPMLSVFVVRNQGQCRGKLCKDLDRGKWCCVSESGVKCQHKMLRGTDGLLVYFLICCDDADLDQIAKHIHLN